MYDGGKIIVGILIFLIFALFPIYSNIGKAYQPPKPKLDTPEIKKMAVKKCVEPKEFMRPEHMKLIVDWRDAALREAKRTYINSRGERYSISLQNTCMKCHSNKKKFCDECHKHAGVKPYCWDCHFVKEEE
jgi:hypothetical protein